MTFSPQSSVVEGKMVVLRCEGEANPSIYHYAWFDWNNQDLHHYEQTLRLEPVTVQHSGAYWCQGINELGQSRSPLTTLTVRCKHFWSWLPLRPLPATPVCVLHISSSLSCLPAPPPLSQLTHLLSAQP